MAARFVVAILWTLVVVCLFLATSLAQQSTTPSPFFYPVTLPPPPAFSGVLAPNNALTRVTRIAHNAVLGPHSILVAGSVVYTSLANGLVVALAPPTYTTLHSRRKIRPSDRFPGCTPNYLQEPALPSNLGETSCGRPFGIRALSPTSLVVVVPDRGIYKWNSVTNVYEWLVDSYQLVDGVPIGFVNDVVVSSDLTLFFTSTSSLYMQGQAFEVFFTGENSGRVLMYRGGPGVSRGGTVSTVIKNICMPTGLELAPDESYLLVAEGARAKIHRAWLGTAPGGPKLDVFAANLPGFPDKIRRSPRGTFWVAFSSIRSADKPSILDRFNADQRRNIYNTVQQEQVKKMIPDYGLVLELDANGQILRSLHDPTGQVFRSVSQVTELNGWLYIGSSDTKYMGLLNVSSISSGTGEGTDAGILSPTSSPVLDLLERVRASTQLMAQDRLQEIVRVLVMRLLEAKMEAQRAVERANLLQQELNALQGLYVGTGMTGEVQGGFSGANSSDLSSLGAGLPQAQPL